MPRQAGLTTISHMIMLSVCAFLAFVVLRLVPAYAQNRVVMDVMRESLAESGASVIDSITLRRKVLERLKARGVTVVTGRQLHVGRSPDGKLTLRVAYEIPVGLGDQIGLVAKFERELKQR